MRDKCHNNFVFVKHQLAPVVQKVDSAIRRINLHPKESAIGFPITYPLDSDPVDRAIQRLNNRGQSTKNRKCHLFSHDVQDDCAHLPFSPNIQRFKPSSPPPPPTKRKHASEETQKALNKFPNDSFTFPFSLSLFPLSFFSFLSTI